MANRILIKNYRDFVRCLNTNGSIYDFEDCFEFAGSKTETGWFVEENRCVVGYRSEHDSEDNANSYLKMKNFPEAESIISALQSFGYRQSYEGLKNGFYLFEMSLQS